MSYANPNYDPAKAHEYYEKHKKLKGNRSTKGFSDEQKEYVAYGKHQLTEQRQKRIKKITAEGQSERKQISEKTKAKNSDVREKKREQVEKIRAAAKVQKERIKANMESKVEALKRQMETMTPEQKARAMTSLKGTVASLRRNLQSSSEKIDARTQKLVANEDKVAKGEMEKNRAAASVEKEGVKAKTKEKKGKEWSEYEKAVDRLYSEARAHSK